jgi:heme-degrading monooxygenase HmoA
MAREVVNEFYGAWNARDVDGVIRTFASGGTFADPFSRATLSAEALRAHVTSLVAALSEVRFRTESTLREGDRVVVVWTLDAVCKGALDRDISADGVSFTLEGIDLFHLSEHGVLSVRRSFERRDLVERLGMQSIVEPIEVGTMTFGYSLRDWASKAKPALLGMTWIQARDEEEKATIRGYARRIIKGFHEIPGFVGVVTGFTGLRGFTLTAWESEDALRAGVHGPNHVEAMRGFHQGLSTGVFTSVWQPLRLNRVWQRCTQCGTPNDAHRVERQCQHCGAPLAEAAPYV